MPRRGSNPSAQAERVRVGRLVVPQRRRTTSVVPDVVDLPAHQPGVGEAPGHAGREEGRLLDAHDRRRRHRARGDVDLAPSDRPGGEVALEGHAHAERGGRAGRAEGGQRAQDRARLVRVSLEGDPLQLACRSASRSRVPPSMRRCRQFRLRPRFSQWVRPRATETPTCSRSAASTPSWTRPGPLTTVRTLSWRRFCCAKTASAHGRGCRPGGQGRG